jgi:hypothetical protein
VDPYGNTTVSTTNSYLPFGTYQICKDTDTGWGKENDFDLTTRYIEGGPINGPYVPSPNYRVDFENFYPAWSKAFKAIPTYTWQGSVKSLLQAVADSHPGEPPLSIPNALYELKDVPYMLKDAGRMASELARKAEKFGFGGSVVSFLFSPHAQARDHLNFTFGWKPFVNDVKSISEVATWSQKRLQYLRNYNRVRRERELGEKHARVRAHGSDVIAYTTINSENIFEGTHREWCTSKWNVYTPVLDAIESSSVSQFANLSKFSAPLDIVYQAIPWSWLVDWFLDIGNVVSLYGNKFGVSLSSVSHMKHVRWETTITPKNPPSAFPEIPVYKQVQETKWRWSGLPTILNQGKTLNFLGPTQLATLGALSVTKTRSASSF